MLEYRQRRIASRRAAGLEADRDDEDEDM
jgi:hypothetical protein